MELLVGMDLNAMVERFGPFPPERAVAFLQQACRSLSEAHTQGLVHRDIKPSNLCSCKLGPDFDFLKVLDLGMVTAAAGEGSKLTQDGSTIGSPAFMAPEQAMGSSAVDARSDLYALGCVAHWMLTGRILFDGDNVVQVLMHHARTPPPRASEVAEQEIPPTLDQLVLDCLAKEPEQRPQSAEVLWQRLSEIAFDSIETNPNPATRCLFSSRLRDYYATTSFSNHGLR